VSGALTERVFVTKLARVGFRNITLCNRFGFSLDRAADYPLFTADLIELMKMLIPGEKHGRVAVSLIVKADLPA
jgi:hypothetical protein